MTHEVQFTDQSQGGNNHTIIKWEWDFGDGTTSNEQNPVHSYDSAGEYNVSLTVTNDCGRSATSTQCIKVGGGNMEHIVDVNIANCDEETIKVPEVCATKSYKFVGAVTGNPIVGGTAELLTADGSTVLQTQTTDANGIATFTNVNYGNYKLKITY